jgi:signal transduction histidine kinase
MALSAIVSGYSLVVGAGLERMATGQVCILTSLLVLLPWSWRAQLAVAAVPVLVVLAVTLGTGTSEGAAYAGVAVVTAAITSTTGAWFLGRQRWELFRRTALLGRASAAAAEEAEIAAALLHVGQTLASHMDAPDLLERVSRLAVEALGTDWGTTFAWDEAADGFVLRGGVGVRAAVAEDLGQLVFTSAALPRLVGTLRAGHVVEIADRDAQTWLDPALLARWDVASELCVPIRRGDVTVGLVCLGDVRRRGPFSPRQHRLAGGIAAAAGVALENSHRMARLEQASRLKSEFVSTMSHELRTPLNVILGCCEMASDPLLPDAERAQSLQRIDRAGRELLELVESTLEIGRIDAGRDEVQRQPVALRGFWTALGASCARVPRQPGVALEWTADPPDVSLLTDPRKLAIVLRNLVGNACKFTTAGRVRVGVAAEGPDVVFAVEDTGIGIRPEDHEAVFEMFRQADGSDSRRFNGSGLGLYIVRRFVEQLGGRVTLDSAPGRGSTFRVHLPATAEASPLGRAA